MATGSSSVTSSGNSSIDGLLGGVRWNSNTIQFNFPVDASYYPANYGTVTAPNGTVVSMPAGFVPVSASFQTMVRSALAEFSAVANLTFEEVGASSASNISVARTTSLGPTTPLGFRGFGYFPSSLQRGGDVWFDDDFAEVGDSQILGRGTWRLVMHELGHAMGLKHAHENGGPANAPVPAAFDFNDYTIMSYRRYQNGPESGNDQERHGNPQTLMMLDIAALQYMYGANFNTNSSNTVYSFNSTTGQMLVNGVGGPVPGANRIYRTIWDGGGVDTYDLSSYANGVNVDLRPGQYSVFSFDQLAIVSASQGRRALGNVFNALQFNGDTRSLIENAIGGAGNDTLTGNAAANHLNGGLNNDSLYGGDGNDTLTGGGGADYMAGGNAIDWYYVDNAGDIVIESTIAGGGSNDRVNASANWTLGAGQQVEEIVNVISGPLPIGLNLTGNELDNRFFGNAGADTLNGGAGNDTIYGQGGADSMVGGAGNDIYFVDNAGDVVIEAAGQGLFDRVYTSINYAIAAGQEIDDVLVLAGSGSRALTGNEFTNRLYGDAGNDTLTGNGGNDYIDGRGGNDILSGGAGIDTVVGGVGNDVFVLTPLQADRDIFPDFNFNFDRFQVSNAAFGGGLDADNNGVLDANRFVANASGTATTADHRFIYMTGANLLIYDSNGSAAGGVNVIGVVTSSGISAASFNVVA